MRRAIRCKTSSACRSGANLLRLALKLVPVTALATLAIVPTSALERLPSFCVFQRLLGVECPGCGMTRAMSAALHGDAAGAFAHNGLIVFWMPVLLLWAGIELVTLCKKPGGPHKPLLWQLIGREQNRGTNRTGAA